MPKSVKKTVPKKRAALTQKKRISTRSRTTVVTSPVTYTRYIIVSFSVLLLVLISTISIHASDKPLVLGTSVFLARDGNDTGNENTSAMRPPPPQNTAPEANSNGGNDGKQGDSSGASGITSQKIPAQNTVVECLGPDKKYFQTTFYQCAQLNNAYGKDRFSYTTLKKQPGKDTMASNSGVPMPPGHGDENRMQNGSDDHPGVKEMHPNGSTDSSDNPDDPGHINKSLDGTGVQIQNDKNNFSMHHNGVKARSLFPITVDPTTKKLHVTTPQGSKDLTVLPDQAVESILQRKIVSSVENESDGTATGSATNTTITQINNQPVFQIKGLSQKKVFGVIPASFAKTVYVSTENGQVVKTDEDFFSKLVESISF